MMLKTPTPLQLAATTVISSLLDDGFDYDAAEKQARCLFSDMTEAHWAQLRDSYEAAKKLSESVYSVCLFALLVTTGTSRDEAQRLVLEKYPYADLILIEKIHQAIQEREKEKRKGIH